MHNAGIILPGGWSVESRLGEGSYGVVYLAQRKIDGCIMQAAVKHISIPRNEVDLDAIRAELGNDAELGAYLDDVRNELMDEYDRMKQLQGHPNIVACSDIRIVEKPDTPGYDVYIWMELLTGLSSRVIEGVINRDETLKIGMDICSALALLAGKGIIHRDIKPQNIFVNGDGTYKIGDFGTAKQIKGTSALMSMKGTYAFMAPEIMQGKPADFTTDIYSLGLVLYRLMNGNKSPFMLPGQASTSSLMDMANARRFAGEPLPPPVNADIELSKIILKACAYEPRNRWQRPEDLYDALAELASGTVVQRGLGGKPGIQQYPPDSDGHEVENTVLSELEKRGKNEPTHSLKNNGKKIAPMACCVAAILIGIVILLMLGNGKGKDSDGTAAATPAIPAITATPTVTPAPVMSGVQVGDYEIAVFSDGSCEITGWKDTKDTDLKIPRKLDNHLVIAIGTGAFSGQEIRRVSIPKSVSCIGVSAFENCEKLEHAEIPEGISCISDSAFAHCENLKKIELPASVTNIGEKVFAGCSNLVSIEVADANSYYYTRDHVLFRRDGCLTVYPAGLNSEAYTIPSETTAIGSYAFHGSAITQLTIPEGVLQIGEGAFMECRMLSKLQIPASVTFIAPYACMYTGSLKEIYVAAENPLYYASRNVLYNRNGMLMCYPGGLEATQFVIPDGISSIGPGAFLETQLDMLEIPESVVSIGPNSFVDRYGAANLQLIVDADSYAGDWAQNNGIPYIDK